MLDGLKKSIKPIQNKKLIQRFADNHGLVYFGAVDQHGDEHQIVRGLTVSHSHSDSHYCIGTYQGYDAAFVEREDAVASVSSPEKTKVKSHTWHIIQIELKTQKDLPHIFIGLHSHSESFYMHLFTKFSYLRPISLGAVYRHVPAFTTHYRIFTRPSRHIEAEMLLTPAISETFLTNFGALAVEIIDGYLYVYSEKSQVRYELFEAMIKNATWLAGRIDKEAEKLA